MLETLPAFNKLYNCWPAKQLFGQKTLSLEKYPQIHVYHFKRITDGNLYQDAYSAGGEQALTISASSSPTLRNR